MRLSKSSLLTLLLLGATAYAGPITISLSSLSTLAAGSTGNGFDVLLTNTSTPDVAIAAFFFEVTSSSSDITFTAATTSTGSAYIFGANSLFGPDIIGSGSTATDLNASDLDSAGSATVASATTVALGHVLFDVSPTAASQLVTFSLVGFPGTSLSDPDLNDIPIATLTGGQFMVVGQASTVPEPRSALLLATSLAAIAGVRRKWVRK